MEFPFSSEICLGFYCNYSGVYLDYSGSVDLTDDEVQRLVNLIRENGGETDVETLGLEEKYPDIYEKLYDAHREAAREANYRHWLMEGYENGYFEEPDDFRESIEEAGLFKVEVDLQALREDLGLEEDEEIDEYSLEDAQDEAFNDALSEYYDSLDEDGKVDFIETYYGDVMESGEPGDFDMDIVIPSEIIEMANKYTVGNPFYFEMEFNPLENWSETISIKGTVVYNEGEFAIVKISFRYLEFDGVVHSYEETRERFPDFEDGQTNPLDEYLWIQTSVEGFNGFIPNDHLAD